MSQVLHFQVVLFPHRQPGSDLATAPRAAGYPKKYRTDLDKTDGIGEPIKTRTDIGIVSRLRREDA